MIMIAAAGAMPFAVQARLERPPAPLAANTLIGGREAQVERTAASARPHHVRRSADGMFYVTAQINGKPIRFLVDTGASMVILSSRDAQAAGVAAGAIDYTDSVNTVAGEARVARVSIDALKIAGRRIDNVEAAIVEDGVGVSLLGHNALAQFDSLSIEGDQLTLR